jgi:hypothetical protein
MKRLIARIRQVAQAVDREVQRMESAKRPPVDPWGVGPTAKRANVDSQGAYGHRQIRTDRPAAAAPSKAKRRRSS